ncbi:hypothetical protein LguiB_005296 [Lonicera macranthoides]
MPGAAGTILLSPDEFEKLKLIDDNCYYQHKEFENEVENFTFDGSMNKAVELSRVEAEKKVREVVIARKKAKEALELFGLGIKDEA